MAKDKLTDYDSAASGNLDVGGISVAEGMLPSGVNNAIREQMSHLADFAAGTSGVDVLKLQDDTDTNSIKLQAPASVTADTTFTLPDGDGASGQTMITDGAGALSWAAPYGNRNLIINGAMQVAQRGTSFSSISGHTYTLDRFAIRNATAVSQSTDIPSGEGFKNSLFYDNDGSRSSINIRQPMEDVTRLLNDTAVTLSFWLKSSAATTISVDLCDVNATNVSVTTSWAKYEVTFPATSNLNPSDSFEAGAGWVDFNFGTDYPDIYITGVQLEVGETATPFEHRSFGDELARCQRYFMQWNANNAAREYVATCNYYDDDDGHGIISTPVAMRVYPSIVYNDLAVFKRGTVDTNSVIIQATTAPVGNINTVPFNMDNAGGLNAGEPFFVGFASSTTGYIQLDAEL